jgi:oxaloacetate decarboxylase gamma subunit
MGDLNFGFQNILNGQGISIAITGMLIVFIALSLISFFIYLLPKFLRVIANI